MTVALIILAVMIALFIWEPVPILVTAIGASIAYAYAGIIPIKDIFAGYNSTTIVLLAGILAASVFGRLETTLSARAEIKGAWRQ